MNLDNLGSVDRITALPVYHIFLTNGQEIYGVMSSPYSNQLRVDQPLVLEQYEHGFGLTRLLPHTPTEKNHILLDRTMIVTFALVHDEMKRFYHLSRFFAEKSFAKTKLFLDQSNVTMAATIAAHEESDGQMRNIKQSYNN